MSIALRRVSLKLGLVKGSSASRAGSRPGAFRQLSSALDSLRGDPISKLVPPGECQFGDEFQAVKLIERQVVSPTSSVLRFQLPDHTQPLQLSTCACLLAKASIGGQDVVRPYTPISTNALTGHMDLLVKNYFDRGTMSTFLNEKVQVGDDSVSFAHIPFNVKIQAPFDPSLEHIVMLTGGSGITPMIQALHSILGGTSSTPRVSLLYGSQSSSDILAKNLLDTWASSYPDQLEVVHILSDEPESSGWDGYRGVIDRKLLEEYLSSDKRTLILVCGPPGLYQALSGPREEADTVEGLLGEMGYTSEQVYKF